MAVKCEKSVTILINFKKSFKVPEKLLFQSYQTSFPRYSRHVPYITRRSLKGTRSSGGIFLTNAVQSRSPD